MDEVGILFCGQSPSVSEVNHEGQGTPYVTGPDQLIRNILQIDKWTKFPRRLVPEGCIFITVKGAGVGKTFAGIQCAIGRDVYAFKPHQFVDKKFLHFALDREIHKVVGLSAGLILGLSRDHIMGHEVPLPPLAEQHRIVAKLDSILPRVEKVRERLEKIPALVKRFRQSVLTAAVTGKLTEGWREKNPGAEAWKDTTIGSEFAVQTGATPLRKETTYHQGGTIPWVKSGDIQNGKIDSCNEFITPAAIRETNAKIFPKDSLLIAMYDEGKTRGQIGWLNFPAATNQACAALVAPKMEFVTRRFVFLFCLSQYDEIRHQAEGGNQPNLSLAK